MRAPAVAGSLFLMGAVAFAGGDTSLLPPSGFLGSWSLDGNPRVFPGSELYGHIDGGAEIFFEFGFQEATVQHYRSPAGELVVECYRMSDPLAALGIYLAKCGRETPDPGLAERHTAGRYQLMFVHDRYVVIVNNPAGAPALAPMLAEFARFIAGRLPPPGRVTAFEPLPKEGLIEGSQRLVRGPVALEAIATLGRGDILLLGGRITAVAGEYLNGGGKHTLIVVAYPDEQAATAAFRNLTSRLDPEIRPLAAGPARLVFRDYDGTFGAASLAGLRLEIQLRLREQPALR